MTTSLKLGDESPYSRVNNWAAEFRRGGRGGGGGGRVEDYERSGRPKEPTTDEHIELVHSLIMCDRRKSLCDTARQTGISFGAVKFILTYILGMSKVSATGVP